MRERNTSTCLHFHSPQLTIHCILHAQIWKNFPIIYETTTFMMIFTDGTILHRPSSWMKTRSNRSVLDVTWTMTWWILDSLGKLHHETGLYIVYSRWWKISMLSQDLLRSKWHSSVKLTFCQWSIAYIIETLDWSSKATQREYFFSQFADNATSVGKVQIIICCSWSEQYKRLHETELHWDKALHPPHSPVCYIEQKPGARIQSGIFENTYLA